MKSLLVASIAVSALVATGASVSGVVSPASFEWTGQQPARGREAHTEA